MVKLFALVALLLAGCLQRDETTAEAATDDGQPPLRGICVAPDWSTCPEKRGYPTCLEVDGTEWQQLSSGETLHYAPATATGGEVVKLCDIGPDGSVIWSAGLDGGK